MSAGPLITPEHVAAVLDALASARSPRTAATKGALADRTGLAPRMIEGTIEHIRRESIALVASGGEGYWLPASLEEAEANVERRHARAIHQMETLQGERALIRRLREAEAAPLTLFGEATVAA